MHIGRLALIATLFDIAQLNSDQIYAVNKTIVEAMVSPHAILFQSKIFSPSSTPKGNKLNNAIHALNDAPVYKYE